MRSPALLVPAVLLLAGCTTSAVVTRHEARVRDAWQCEVEAEGYLGVAKNANDIRYLMIESCMAMRGHTPK